MGSFGKIRDTVTFNNSRPRQQQSKIAPCSLLLYTSELAEPEDQNTVNIEQRIPITDTPNNPDFSLTSILVCKN